jgi:hypothetical protein
MGNSTNLFFEVGKTFSGQFSLDGALFLLCLIAIAFIVLVMKKVMEDYWGYEINVFVTMGISYLVYFLLAFLLWDLCGQIISIVLVLLFGGLAWYASATAGPR